MEQPSALRPSALRVLVIADDILARTGLVALLQDDEKLDIIGQMQPDTTLFDDIATYAPDVLLYDTGWSYDNDEDTLAELRRSILPMLVLSEAEHVEALRQQLFLEDVALSYVGILPRQSEGRAIEIALQAVARGLLVIDPAFADQLLMPTKSDPEVSLESLTPREEDVLHLLAKGMTNKAIALQLGITDHTVKYHVNAIMGKLNAQSRTDAVMIAMRAGLIVL
jgi:two-component system nitrate/nitrite response regulator NarL